MTDDDHSLHEPLSQPFLFGTNYHKRDGVLVRMLFTLLQIPVPCQNDGVTHTAQGATEFLGQLCQGQVVVGAQLFKISEVWEDVDRLVTILANSLVHHSLKKMVWMMHYS
jgi:hypothetical protein